MNGLKLDKQSCISSFIDSYNIYAIKSFINNGEITINDLIQTIKSSSYYKKNKKVKLGVSINMVEFFKILIDLYVDYFDVEFIQFLLEVISNNIDENANKYTDIIRQLLGLGAIINHKRIYITMLPDEIFFDFIIDNQ